MLHKMIAPSTGLVSKIKLTCKGTINQKLLLDNEFTTEQKSRWHGEMQPTPVPVALQQVHIRTICLQKCGLPVVVGSAMGIGFCDCYYNPMTMANFEAYFVQCTDAFGDDKLQWKHATSASELDDRIFETYTILHHGFHEHGVTTLCPIPMGLEMFRPDNLNK